MDIFLLIQHMITVLLIPLWGFDRHMSPTFHNCTWVGAINPNKYPKYQISHVVVKHFETFTLLPPRPRLTSHALYARAHGHSFPPSDAWNNTAAVSRHQRLLDWWDKARSQPSLSELTQHDDNGHKPPSIPLLSLMCALRKCPVHALNHTCFHSLAPTNYT